MVFGLLFWLIIIYLIVRAFFRRRTKMHRWLQRQLPLWEEKNIITTEQGEAILGFYKLKRAKPGAKMDMVKVLTLIGSIFIGIGVIFFVASNWQKIPPNLRTFMLLLITLSTLYAGYGFSYEKEGFAQLGKSLFLLAALFWGGTIALIGQIYHIPVSENWYILLLWTFPILPIAILFKNDYVHILASVLFVIWNFLYTVNTSTANYYYPAIIFAFMLPTAKNLILSRRINIIGLILAGGYCCFNKYEWLALFISVGLLVYYLLRSEERAYLYTACLSFVFWAIAYSTIRQEQPNFYFLIPAAFLLYLTYKDNIGENLVIWIVGLVIWLNLTLASFSKIWGYGFDVLNCIVFQSLLGILLYVTGIIAKKKGYLFVEIYKVFGYLAVFICAYFLSFQAILQTQTGKINNIYFYCALLALLVSVALIIKESQGGYFRNKDTRIELTAIIVALAGNLLMITNPQGITVNTVIANTVLVIFAFANIFFGVEIKRPPVFTMGILIFALFIITRYIDVGWRLKEKSLFFIAGGIVILSLGTFLEKQRRKIIEGMKSR